MLKGRHLVDPNDFSLEELNEIFDLAKEIINNPSKFSHVCDNKILATLFYEPSTRTRFSFESAMMKLGGNILGFSEPNSTSTSKGETLGDTIKMVSIYSDIIAIRHPKEGSAKLASLYSNSPVINAGDGGHQHPTQTLTDLLTIKELKGSLDNKVIGICGDLKNGRTVHSLIKSLGRYKNNKFILISPEELRIPEYIREILMKNNIEFKEKENLEDEILNLDILYMTRIQKERFLNEEEYFRLKDSYILDLEKMKKAKKDMIVMHPLPRVNEISVEVDKDERAKYFKQAEYGMYVRMALICKLLGVLDSEENDKEKREFKPNINIAYENLVCSNSKCITKDEKYILNTFKLLDENKKTYKCDYCESIESLK